jgi:MoaA/NifB/PqqE/SkfB family radical SAM enzyme
MNKSFYIPDWLAFRTYFFGTNNSKTVISNEYKHEYVLLEALSSDFWFVLANSSTFDEINNWAIEHKIDNQVESFIAVLKKQGLLLFDTENGTLIPDEQNNKDEDETATIQFETDLKKWCFANGLLFSLFIELTYSCNLNCVHCFNPKDNNHQIEFNEIKKIIDDAYEIGCFRLTLSGGEATLHKDFINIVKYARNKRMSVEFFSNGQLLNDNPNFFDEIKKLYPYRIGLSIYSMDSQEHDNVTNVKGSWNKVVNTAKRLRENNINVQIKNFLLSQNYKSCISVKNFAKTIKASYVADLSLIPTIEGDKKTLSFEVGEEGLFSLYSTPESPLFIKDIIIKDFLKLLNTPLCYGGFSSLSISPLLDVFPCCSMPYKIANLKEKSLIEIWNNSLDAKKDSKLYQLQNTKGKDLKDCYKEDYCKFCNYCPGMGMLENGFLRKSDVLCRQAKVKMKAYKKIISWDK